MDHETRLALTEIAKADQAYYELTGAHLNDGYWPVEGGGHFHFTTGHIETSPPAAVAYAWRLVHYQQGNLREVVRSR